MDAAWTSLPHVPDNPGEKIPRQCMEWIGVAPLLGHAESTILIDANGTHLTPTDHAAPMFTHWNAKQTGLLGILRWHSLI
ncbi:hypothetical protein ACKKBF_B39800 [Auxenochlorella protothecoides x Auxenochlorella symbiontica]